MEFFEATYDRLLDTVFSITNPIKKSLIKTQCDVHKFINIYSLRILKNDELHAQYHFFNTHITDINRGAVWADQDYKSSNHFYNPFKKRGLYGRSDAMELGIDYYYTGLGYWSMGDIRESMFYLGAALHIIQDMTVPQHANIRLLDNHRQYETYIKMTYKLIDEFRVTKGAYTLDNIEDYIRFNTRLALRIHKQFKNLKKDDDRFYHIAKCGLPLAQRTTAGAMYTFYRDMFP